MLLLKAILGVIVVLIKGAILLFAAIFKKGCLLLGLTLPFPLGGLGAMTYQQAMSILNWAGGAWSTQAIAGALTLTVAQMLGAGEVYLSLTGAPGAGFNLTTPTAAAILAQLTQLIGFVPPPNFTWQFIMNNQTGQTATLVGGTGVTVNGTTTLATGGSRDWLCTLTANGSSPAVVIQSVN